MVWKMNEPKKYRPRRTKHYSFLMGLRRQCAKVHSKPLLDNDKTDILKYSTDRERNQGKI